MRKTIFAATLVLTFISVSFGQDPGWPRQKSSPAGKLVYYQPQVDSWTNHKDLEFRMAFSLTPTGGKQTVGVVSIRAKTDVNVDARTVLLHNPVITDTHFPSLDANAAARMDQLVRAFLPPSSSVVISLDRLVASVDKTESASPVPVRNEPPMIFVSSQPAILVQVDGQPVLADIKDTKLQFVVNTNWPLFLDKSKSNYYLFTGKRWLTAANPNGPWSITATLPKDMSKLAKDPQWSGLAKAISPPATDSGAASTVFYSTGPAEVILFQGQPVYTRIAGTQLVYAANTDADLFVHSPARQFYYLAAGRWFRSDNLEGPWVYATPDLPADFARIPVTSPASRVLVSVPGTEQAKDAVLLAQIPTTVTVNPASAAAQVKVTYSGTPEFRPIEGTSLSYATNTTDKVIKVGNEYYLCLQGIWFMSPNPQGPWTTAPSVPAAIYTIPPSSPVYNVTYVTQTTSSDGNVQASHTAGYMGAFIIGVGVGAIIANGTGYYYPPYFYYGVGYPVYHPYAATYGVGAFYHPYTGAYGVAHGVYGPYGGATGWAGYNPYTGTYARGGSVYGPYGSASVGRAYNPYTGTYARGASVSTAYGTRSAAGAYNPYTGVGAATRQGSSPYGQWGTSVVARGDQAVQTGHISNSQGTVVGARSTSGAAAVAGSGRYGNSGGVARTASGDLYATKDGNVYRNTNGSWESHDNGSWNSVNKPTPTQQRPQTRPNPSGSYPHAQAQSTHMQGLNQEFQNRQRGAAQSQHFQNMQRSGGGGGRFGGGGGGRARTGGGRRRG